jgi:hypothetical protein
MSMGETLKALISKGNKTGVKLNRHFLTQYFGAISEHDIKKSFFLLKNYYPPI